MDIKIIFVSNISGSSCKILFCDGLVNATSAFDNAEAGFWEDELGEDELDEEELEEDETGFREGALTTSGLWLLLGLGLLLLLRLLLRLFFRRLDDGWLELLEFGLWLNDSGNSAFL